MCVVGTSRCFSTSTGWEAASAQYEKQFGIEQSSTKIVALEDQAQLGQAHETANFILVPATRQPAGMD